MYKEQVFAESFLIFIMFLLKNLLVKSTDVGRTREIHVRRRTEVKSNKGSLYLPRLCYEKVKQKKDFRSFLLWTTHNEAILWRFNAICCLSQCLDC